jgi:hypothetical protein
MRRHARPPSTRTISPCRASGISTHRAGVVLGSGDIRMHVGSAVDIVDNR